MMGRKWYGRAVLQNGLVLLSFVAAIAVGVRCYRLGGPELTRDESFSWRLTQYPAAEVIQRTASDVHPPLYYLALQTWDRVWSDSPAAIRAFSVLCGFLSIPVFYALCQEACTDRGSKSPPGRDGAQGGALLGASVMAIHLAQVMPSRTARMYSLGVLLAGFTAWLLLRAMRAQANREVWWSAYGVAAATFCYVHNYALFTICAQGVFVLGDLLMCARRDSFRNALPSVFGFAFAAILALLLYSPWLPVLNEQLHTVREGYWIPAVTRQDAERVLFTWLAGMEYLQELEAALWLAPLAALALWRVIRGDRAAYFFVVQAALPWLANLGISLWSGRSIFFDRYLVFAHLSLLGLWGILWCRLPDAASRVFLACWIVLPCLYGLGLALAQVPEEPPAIAKAAGFLKEHYQPEDVVYVPNPIVVNPLRYYAAQVGLRALPVRCTVSAFGHPGHQTHVASLEAQDITWPDAQGTPPVAGRMWQGSEGGGGAGYPCEGMQIILQETFDGGGGTHYRLVLYEKTP